MLLSRRQWGNFARDFAEALELLKVVLHWDGELCHRIILRCLDLANKPFRLSRSNMNLALGRILAKAFLESRSDAASFFKSLIQEFDHEDERKRIALYILQNLPEDACKRIAQCRKEFGLPSETKVGEHFNAVLIPETQAELLAALADALSHSDAQLASELLLDAADLAATVPDERDREDAALKVLLSAMRIAPGFVWEVYPRCGIEPFWVLAKAEAVFLEYARLSGDMRELLLRLDSELILTMHERMVDTEKTADYRSYINLWRRARENSLDENLVFPHDSLDTKQPSPTWLRAIPDFFIKSIDNIDRDYLRFDLREVAESVAMLDWDSFMAILRDPRMDATLPKYVTRFLRPERLRGCLFKSKIEPSKLLSDIAVIQRAMGDDIKRDELDDMKLRSITVAAAAAYDPDTCLEMTASLPRASRRRFIGNLEHFTPEGEWTVKQLSRLFQLFESYEDKEDVVVCEARMLGWLGRNFPVAAKLLEPIVSTTTKFSKSRSIMNVAEYISNLDAGASDMLMKKALDPLEKELELAVKSCEPYEILKIVDEAELLPAKIRLHALEVARESAIETEERFYLSRVAKHQVSLDLEESVRTLDLMRPDDSSIDDSSIKEVLDTLSDAIILRDEYDIESWVSKLSGLQNLDHEHRNRFARSLVNRGLQRGTVKTSRTFQHITNVADRVEAYLLLSVSLQESERASTLKRAYDETERASSIQQRYRAFLKLADFYTSFDTDQALEFYKRSLREITKSGSGSLFSYSIGNIVAGCIRLPNEQSAQLALEIYNASLNLTFANPFNRVEKYCGLFWSAIAFRHSDRSRVESILSEAATDLDQTAVIDTPSSGISLVSISYACLDLARKYSMADAKEILSEFLGMLSNSQRQKVSDILVEEFCKFPPDEPQADMPEEYLGIRRQAMDDTSCILIRHLLPLCSVEGAALAHLTLGLSAYGKEHETVVNEITQAARIAEQTKDTLDRWVYRDIWTAYAAVSDLSGCLHAIRMLLPESERIERDSSHLLLCLIDRVPQKLAFLRDLWSALESLKEYA